MSTCIRTFTVFALFVTLISCSDQKSLSRAKAKELITAEHEWLREPFTVLSVDPAAYSRGSQAGLWSDDGVLAPEARSVLASVAGGDSIVLKEPIRAAITVTGITDAPSMEGKVKEIEFTWAYTELPSIGQVFASNGGQGKASARLYDDGWRLEGMNIFLSNDPYQASASAQAAFARLERSIKARHEKAAVKAREEELAQLRRFEALVAESRHQTKIIAAFTDRKTGNRVKVTDVSILGIRGTNMGGGATGQDTDAVWFCYLEAVRTVYIEAQANVEFTGGQAFLQFADEQERTLFSQTVREAQQSWRTRFPGVRSDRWPYCPN